MSIFSTALIFPFVLLAAVIWSVVGLFFWVPLLAKSTTIFTLSLVTHAIVNRPIVGAVYNLQTAIAYYINGFYNIFKTLDLSSNVDPRESNIDLSLVSSIFANLANILGMVIFASIFWALFFIFVHHAGLIQIQAIMNIEKQLWLAFRT